MKVPPLFDIINNMNTVSDFKRGFFNAFSIFVLYFGVSFSLGIACYNAGMSVFESALMSALNLTSAGEFAAVKIMSVNGSFLEIALSQIVINLRYLLMSAALLIKLRPNEKTCNKMLMGFGITDEIFGISVIQKDPLNPFYVTGAISMAAPGWILGTALGVILGNILPSIVLASLSMAIYAMFISLVIIPSRKDTVLFCIVIFSMALSYLCTKIFPSMESGLRCVVLTVFVSALAAYFFPHEEKKQDVVS